MTRAAAYTVVALVLGVVGWSGPGAVIAAVALASIALAMLVPALPHTEGFSGVAAVGVCWCALFLVCIEDVRPGGLPGGIGFAAFPVAAIFVVVTVLQLWDRRDRRGVINAMSSTALISVVVVAGTVWVPISRNSYGTTVLVTAALALAVAGRAVTTVSAKRVGGRAWWIVRVAAICIAAGLGVLGPLILGALPWWWGAAAGALIAVVVIAGDELVTALAPERGSAAALVAPVCASALAAAPIFVLTAVVVG